MADIQVDTYKLNQYAQRISNVNGRISRLDRRLDALYWRVGLLGLWNLIQADALTGYSWRLTRCQSYLQLTATDFEKAEEDLVKMGPMSFQGARAGHIDAPAFQTWEQFNSSLVERLFINDMGALQNSTKKEESKFLKDIESAGEGLARIEKLYGMLPKDIDHALDTFLPSSLKDAYTLTSGILQGDLTWEEGWDIAKNILSENTKLAVICETLTYTFEKGEEREDKMMEDTLAQMREGDLLGTLFEGAEGFVDIILCGSIEVGSTVAGDWVDGWINDKAWGLKFMNKGFKYATGMLDMNDGEGYSVGGLIKCGGELLSNGIDKGTDLIVEGVNVVTDALTDGAKWGIKQLRSLFS